MKKDCYAWQKNIKEKSGSSNRNETQEVVNYGDGYDSGEVLLVSNADTSQEWILDLGCTYHMTHNNGLLTDCKSIDGANVVLGKSDTCQEEGIGTPSIKMFDSTTRHLTNVRYVPQLRNLISLEC